MGSNSQLDAQQAHMMRFSLNHMSCFEQCGGTEVTVVGTAVCSNMHPATLSAGIVRPIAARLYPFDIAK